jgi:hypothetical protein
MKKWFHLSIERMPVWFSFISTVVFIGFIITVLPQQSALAEANGLVESIDTSWFYSSVDLYRIADIYGLSGRQFYIYQRWTFDVIWPLVYFGFIYSVSVVLYRSLHSPKLPVWILSFIWLGTLFDFIENTLVSIVMARYPSTTFILADLAGPATGLKWIFIGLSFILLTVLLFIKLIEIIKTKFNTNKQT